MMNSRMFSGIECFKGTFSLQMKERIKLYQAPLRFPVYVLQKPFKDELGKDETEWQNNFVLVPKPSEKV